MGKESTDACENLFKPFLKRSFFDSGEIFNAKLNAQVGFHPRRFVLPHMRYNL